MNNTCRHTAASCCISTTTRPSPATPTHWHEDGLLIVDDGRVSAAGDYAQLAATPAGRRAACTTCAAS